MVWVSPEPFKTPRVAKVIRRLAKLQLVTGGAGINLHSTHWVAHNGSVFTTSSLVMMVVAVRVVGSIRHGALVHLDMMSGSRLSPHPLEGSAEDLYFDRLLANAAVHLKLAA